MRRDETLLGRVPCSHAAAGEHSPGATAGLPSSARKRGQDSFSEKSPDPFVLLAIAFTALAFSCAAFAEEVETAPAAPLRPNIILMMADDQGWGDTSYNGHKRLRTPNLDAMARAGLRMDRFYAAAPVCSPTRGSCLTGRHPYRYGVFFANTGHMRPGEWTLAEALRSRGYATGHFGKWHLGTLSKTDPSPNRGKSAAKHFAPPWLHGFDESFSTEAKTPTYNPMIRGARRGTWWDPVDKGPAYGTPYYHNGKQATENLKGDDSRVIMDRAIPFIRRAAKAKKPFFAVIWFHAPHLPVVAGPRHTRPYADLDQYTRHYYGCIAALDEQVGRLRRELRTLGVERDTMLWYCSDNGPEGNDRAPGRTGGLRGRKRSLYEGGVRVPGILVWPNRIATPRVTAFPCCTSDYLPTILDVLNLKHPGPSPVDGVSLLPLIDGKMTKRPRPIAFESRSRAALVDNRYKLVVSTQNRKGKPAKIELYDLTGDRAEKNDLAAELPQIAARMNATLSAWRASCRRSNNGEDYK